MKASVMLRGIVMIATLALLGFLFQTSEINGALDEGWIESHIMGRGIIGELLFLGMATFITAVGLPRQVISFLGGYAFGLVMGTVLALMGTVLGCAIAFYYARILARAPIQKRFSTRVRTLDNFLHDNTFSMTLLVRMLPVGSNVATNLAAGVSSVRGFPFIGGSAIGYLPQTLVFALAGSGIAVDPELRIGLSIILFVLSGALGVYLYRHFRHGKSLDSEIDKEIGEASDLSKN
ncbi:MAG: VTT domain-containing protein [Rhodospirillaceae bacterium]|nr:VTT domain-containing protein [Rhodospirillaceae bacterium]